MNLLNFEPIFEFSRQNCVAICAFLVPANLLTTALNLILLFTQRSQTQIRLAISLSVIFAFTLFLHVSTWFIIGVVTPVTFILLGLGATCLTIAILADIYRHKLLAIRLPVEMFQGKSLLQKK
ncbi:MAG: hypothetical protein QNJ41_18700 [Xenococcaceae cyanobacterium MO_188.B32]|nr:hypothetical protein [Xenococcaceae cyanobacterium MO_188.B32]